MAITFKQFHTFVSMNAEPTDEQITEIFGAFSGNADKKIDDLKKKREELTAAQKAERARKDAAFKAAKEKAEGRAPKSEPEQGSGTARARQARERGMEYGDWRVAEGRLTEGKKVRSVADKWFTANYFDDGKDKDFELPFTEQKDGDDVLVTASVTTNNWETAKDVIIRVKPSGEVIKSSVAEWKAAGGYWNPRAKP